MARYRNHEVPRVAEFEVQPDPKPTRPDPVFDTPVTRRSRKGVTFGVFLLVLSVVLASIAIFFQDNPNQLQMVRLCGFWAICGLVVGAITLTLSYE